MKVWDYLIKGPSGATAQSFGIAMGPEQYAAQLRTAGFTVEKIVRSYDRTLKPPDTGAGPLSVTEDARQNGKEFEKNSAVYRLIHSAAPGRVDTGATYPSCSRGNPEGCRPRQFKTVAEAVKYAKTNQEIPVKVVSAEQAWRIVEGTEAPPVSQSILETINITPVGAIGGLLLLVVGARWLGRRSG